MSELIKTKRYKSGEEFLTDISYGGEMYKAFNNNFVYRGHQSGAYKLMPSVLRDSEQSVDADVNEIADKDDFPINIRKSELIQMTKEYMELKNFFSLCDINGLKLPPVERFRRSIINPRDVLLFFIARKEWIPDDLHELAALAQHYGMKTRLLDWTMSLETAIYFAVHKEPELSPEEIAEEDSDCVAIWALNLYADFDSKTPLRIIRPPYYGNANLAAQKGLFTYWNVTGLDIPLNGGSDTNIQEIFNQLTNLKPLDELIETEFKKLDSKDVIMWKLLIPRKDRKKLYEYIRKRNVSAASLFPGYAGVVRAMEEDK